MTNNLAGELYDLYEQSLVADAHDEVARWIRDQIDEMTCVIEGLAYE
jgi:hypothetical protein